MEFIDTIFETEMDEKDYEEWLDFMNNGKEGLLCEDCRFSEDCALRAGPPKEGACGEAI